MVPMTDEDIQEIRTLVNLEESWQPEFRPHVTKNNCHICGRAMHFADLINGALASKVHSKSFIRKVLKGEMGYFVIVPGTNDDSHRSKCLNCGDMTMLWSHGCGYQNCNGNYYAHCAW